MTSICDQVCRHRRVTCDLCVNKTMVVFSKVFFFLDPPQRLEDHGPATETAAGSSDERTIDMTPLNPVSVYYVLDEPDR